MDEPASTGALSALVDMIVGLFSGIGFASYNLGYALTHKQM